MIDSEGGAIGDRPEISKSASKAAAMAARKANGKKVRALEILKKDTGILESSNPCKIIFVCNAGLVTGTASSDLVRVFSKFGPIESVTMVPQKSYSFLTFARLEAAQTALETVHGKVGLSEAGPLYLAYVEATPPLKDPWKDHQLPPGVSILAEFVSEQEEKEILDSFDWDDDGEGENMLKHRQVKHFGFEFSYKTNNIDPSQPLEQGIPPLCSRVGSRALSAGLVEVVPDQLTVNRYLPGQGIPPHTDSHDCCTSTILSLSLESGVTMDFRGPQDQHVPVWLPARSLLVMTAPARYTWRHGITPRHCDTVPGSVLGHSEGLTLAHRDTRVSLTLRKTFPGPCSCSFPGHCDRSLLHPELAPGAPKLNPTSPEFLDKIAQKAALLETQLVHQVYEEIAGHFSETRHKPWPRVLQFLDTVQEGGLMLDLGCGNGKYLGQGRELRWELGGDYSQNLLGIVTGRGHQAVRCDLLAVPLKDCSVSGVICIAALHHLASHDRRVAALAEMSRVLVTGGRMLVYVWAKDQKRQELSSYLKQNKKNLQSSSPGSPGDTGARETGQFGLPVHVNRTQFQQQDNLVPWKLKKAEGGGAGDDQVFMRYYHVFEEGELEQLVGLVEGLQVEEGYYDQGNWCVIATKV